MPNVQGLSKLAGKVEFDYPLSRMTTFRVGGPAKAAVFPASREELKSVVRYCLEHQLPHFTIGLGSNLLVSDSGFDGVVIRLSGELRRAETDGNLLIAGAGASIMKACRLAQENGLSGLEFAAAIPGTTGGAAVMNAGAHQSDISSIIREIHIINQSGETEILSPRDVKWGYRQGLKNSRYIITTIFNLTPDSLDKIQKKMDNYLSVRNHSQPKGFSAGSVFRNPEGLRAWELIQNAGLKGASVGGAVISDMHANFILNRGNASGSDIYRLIRTAQKAVRETQGVELQPEIKYIGDFGD